MSWGFGLHMVLAACSLVIIGDSARAANIEHTKLEDGAHLITIIGDLASGDEEKFRRLSVQYDSAVVALASDGGALNPAIEIGKMIRLKEFPTVVLNDFDCTSACALIWVAGSTRYLAPKGRVGFHASYKDVGGRKVETGLGNALVGRYLTLLNLPEKAVLFATAAPPDRVLWLTVQNKTEAGIDFEPFGGSDASPPPVVRTHVVPSTTETAAGERASGWEYVASAKSKDYYLNAASIRRVGSYWSAWNRIDANGDASVGYHQSKELWYYDCSARRIAIKAWADYDRYGKSVKNGELRDYEVEWQSVVPETVGEAKLQAVCR